MNRFYVRQLKPGHPLRARDFMHAVGLRTFGDLWEFQDIKTEISDSDPYRLGNSQQSEDRKIFVQFNILDALATGKITAEVHIGGISPRDLYYRLWCRDPAHKLFKRAFPNGSPPEYDGDADSNCYEELVNRLLPARPSDHSGQKSSADLAHAIAIKENIRDELEDAWLDFEEEVPEDLTARIGQDFWVKSLERCTVDWYRSDVEIPARDLVLELADSALGRKIKLDEEMLQSRSVTAILWIRNAESAIKTASTIPAALEKIDWGTEHLKNKKYNGPELIAAIWRIIAIKELKRGHGVQAKILEHLEEFLNRELREGETTPPHTDSRLLNVVSEICHQWENFEFDADITVNTGAHLRKPPRKKSISHQ